ncbi:hypothetical protein ACFE04_001030 [Oxalis oulophora]
MDSYDHMTCTLKLDTKYPGWHVALLKVLRTIDGIKKYSINAEKGIVEISGNIDPDKILRLLESAAQHVQLLKLESGSSHGNYGEISSSHMPRNYYDYGRSYGYHGYGPYGGYGSAHEPTYNWYKHHNQPYYYSNYYDQIASPSYYRNYSHQLPYYY